MPGAGKSQAWDRYAYTLNNPIKYVDPTGHLSEDEWIRLYGYEAWLAFKETLSEEMLTFLTSDSFTFGNIVILQFGEGKEPVHLLIGESKDGGIAFYSLDDEGVYSGGTALKALQVATSWGALVRQPSSDGDYFSGGYKVASSNSCPYCNSDLANSYKPPKDWWKNPMAPNFIPGQNGFVYIHTTSDTAQSIKGMLYYYFGIGTIAAGCAASGLSTRDLGPCLSGLFTGGLLFADGLEDMNNAIIDQQIIIVDMTLQN